MARDYLPVDPGKGNNPLQRVWVPQAVSEPILLLSTVNFAALHLERRQGRSSSPQILADKLEIIRLVNARLECPDEAVSDETIGAVAMLAAAEVCCILS